MDTHTIGTAKRPGARVVLVVVALVIAASALTIQARSIWSTPTKPLVRPAVAQVVPQQPNDPGASGSKATHRPSLRQVQAKRSG